MPLIKSGRELGAQPQWLDVWDLKIFFTFHKVGSRHGNLWLLELKIKIPCGEFNLKSHTIPVLYTCMFDQNIWVGRNKDIPMNLFRSLGICDEENLVEKL